MTGEFEDYQKSLMEKRPDLFRINSKFAPKLSFADRCACFLFWKHGIEVPVLATAFNLNRGTVRYITNTSSRFYKNVRQEWVELGPDAFHNAYWTQQWADAVEKAKNLVLSQVTEAENKKMKAENGVPNKKARQKAGKHYITFGAVMGGVTLQFDVQWMDLPPPTMVTGSERTPGWYLVLLKTPDERGWPVGVYGDAENSITSSKALTGFLEETESEITEI